MLAQAAKATVPPLLHAVAKQIQHFGRQAMPEQQPGEEVAAIWSQASGGRARCGGGGVGRMCVAHKRCKVQISMLAS